MSKNSIGSGKWWYVMVFALTFLASPGAWAGIGIFGSAGPGDPSDPLVSSFSTTHEFLITGGWAVGGPADLINGPGRAVITADPNENPWRKELLIPNVLPSGVPFQLVESLTVGGPGPDWRDWHETIQTPGFSWVIGTGTLTAGTQIVFGSVSDLDSNGTFETIEFLFAPLAPGTDVTINKQMQCVVVFCAENEVIGVMQFPTTERAPEPGTLLLLAGGLAGLAALRRRRS